MDKDFDEIILCIPGATFFILNILHLPATFFIFTHNDAMLLTVAAPTVLMQLIALIPIIATLVFLIIFRSEVMVEVFTATILGAFIYQGVIFWINILPIMLTYVTPMLPQI